jgi:DNA polymerase III psi subunit
MEKISDGGLIELFRSDYIVAPKLTVEETGISNEKEIEVKPLVVITNVPLTNEDKVLLTNILNAVKININTTPILQNVSFADVKEKHATKNLISFGKSGYDLGIKSVQLDLYSPKEYEGIQILVADAVSKISISSDKKKALWLNLKRLFNI